MFRSSTIIRELALNLAKVIFMLKLSVKLRRYLLCGCVAACHGMACVLHAVHFAGAFAPVHKLSANLDVHSCTGNHTHTHNRLGCAAIALITFISTGTVEPYL